MSTGAKVFAAIGLLAVIALFARPQSVAALAADDESQSATSGLKAGEPVTIYLRGDATGSSFHDRVPALGNLISRSGKILSADRSWVVIESKTGKSTFPRESIAMIESVSE